MIRLVALLAVCLPLHAEDTLEVIAARKRAHIPKMEFLDNGTIKIGVDLNLGGAITYLSRSGRDENIVNNWDWGRQIQMSHYSGPVPLLVPGKEPARAWAKFGWNPVQAGDHFGYASTLVASSSDGKELRTACVPKQWSFPDVPTECRFETRITLDGAKARVRCKVMTNRKDTTAYPAMSQECPAIYVNAAYCRLMTYSGDEPFTGGESTRILHRVKKDGFPWARFTATERWAAQVNDDGFGLGVYQPAGVSFLGGFSGKPGAGGTHDPATGYIAPLRNEAIDPVGTFEYEYTLILGQLADIRKAVYELHGPAKPPTWTFDTDRQGWNVVNGESRVKDAWTVTCKPGTQLVGPMTFWQAKEGPVLTIEAAFRGKGLAARIFWHSRQRGEFTAEESGPFPLQGDGEMRTYRVPLGEARNYAGSIMQLRIDPGDFDEVRIKSISIGTK